MFVLASNPNYPTAVDVQWPAYNTSHQSYIELDKDMGEHSQKHFMAAEVEHFWLHVMPGLLTPHHDGGDTNCPVAGSVRHAGNVLMCMFMSLFIFCLQWMN